MDERYDVFLCHNSQDKRAIVELAGKLREKGIKAWIDQAELPGGLHWLNQVAAAIKKCGSFAVFVGPNGLGQWQETEIQMAMDRHVKEVKEHSQHLFPIIPVLLPGADFDNIPAYLAGHTGVRFAKRLDDETIPRLACYIRGTPPEIGLAGLSESQECPYRGLQSFDVAQARWFFGRAGLTNRLIEKLRGSLDQDSVPGRFLAIVGASGSGKSSLARAGLVAALKRGAIAGSDQWPVVICRPGSDPCASVAVELAKVGGLDLERQQAFRDRLKDRMQQDRAALDADVQLVLSTGQPDRRLLILVDQFEELFTICRDEKLRTALVNNLVYASQIAQGRAMVLLAMRADFYGKCATNGELANALSENQQLIGPMTRDELREAIEKPAQMAGCELEAGLVDLLVNEVADQPGSLPFLQFALMELWNRRTGRHMTTAAYREIGGVAGALQRKADEVYSRLSQSQQQICRRIFLRLTQPGEGTEDTKRRVPRSELEAKSGSTQELDLVLSDLSKAETRLVTGEAREGKAFVEVAHEALIRGWPKLRSWIDADRQALVTQRRLTEAANLWIENKRDANFVYRGGRLVEAREWAASHALEINPLEAEFIDASEKEARRSMRVRRFAFGALVALTILAVIGGGIAEQQKRRADEERQQANEQRQRADDNARQAVSERKDAERAKTLADASSEIATAAKIDVQRRLAESFLDRGLRFCDEGEAGKGVLWLARGLKGLTLSKATASGAAAHPPSNVPTSAPDPESAILANLAAWRQQVGSLKTLLQHQAVVTAVAFSPDGKTALTASDDDTARLWLTATGAPIGQVLRHQAPVLAIAYSPDGTTLVTGSEDKSARLWNAATGQPMRAPLMHQKSVFAVAYTPDSKTIVTGSADGTARLWNAATCQPIGPPLQHRDFVRAVAVSPNGKTVVTGSDDKTARLWDAATGEPIGSPLEHRGHVRAVAFSPDSKTVVTGSDDNTARLWDARSGQPIGAPLEHRDHVRAVAVSPDGATVLTGSDDSTARLWDAATGEPAGSLPSLRHHGPVRAVAFNLDGSQVLTASDDKTARLWDAATGKPIGAPLEHPDGVWAVALSPDGKTVLTAGWDKSARMWDAPVGGPFARPLEHRAAVLAAAYSADGRRIVTGSGDNSAQLWDVETAKPIGAPLGHRGPVSAVAFSRDSSKIVTGSEDNLARLWNAESGKLIVAPLEHGGHVGAVAFSPDGKMVLTGSKDRMARRWNAVTGKLIGAPLEHLSDVWFVAFSADGKTFLTGSQGTTARLWDAETGRPIGAPMQHDGDITAITFSPNGKTVLTGSEDNTARLWDGKTGQPIGVVLPHQGHVTAVAFSPLGDTVVTGCEDNTARLWDAQTGQPIGAPLHHQGSVTAVAYNSDGKTVLTGSEDSTARLWDAATGKPIGPPLRHERPVKAVACRPGGNMVLTRSNDIIAQLWTLPVPAAADPEGAYQSLELVTGMKLDEGGTLHMLSRRQWLDRRQRLGTLASPPIPPPEALLTWHETQAAKSEYDRKWFAAAFHLRLLIVAHPNDTRLRMRLSLALAGQASAELAAGDYAGFGDTCRDFFEKDVKAQVWSDAEAALKQAFVRDSSSKTLQSLGSAQLAAGDDAGFRDTCRKLFERDGKSSDLRTRDDVSWLAVQSAAGASDWTPYTSLAGSNCRQRATVSVLHETYGATLYRAGRFSEARDELTTAMLLAKERTSWTTLLFLSLVESNLGDRDKAVGYLHAAAQKFELLNVADWKEQVRLVRLGQEAVQLLSQRRPVTAERPRPKP